MPLRRRPNEKICSALSDGSPLCKIRKPGKKPSHNWREVTCMSCLCDMVDWIQRRIEKVMDAPYIEKRPPAGARLPRQQLKGDWED